MDQLVHKWERRESLRDPARRLSSWIGELAVSTVLFAEDAPEWAEAWLRRGLAVGALLLALAAELWAVGLA
jgi:hypothetical protein